jgi:hypothetical protein
MVRWASLRTLPLSVTTPFCTAPWMGRPAMEESCASCVLTVEVRVSSLGWAGWDLHPVNPAKTTQASRLTETNGALGFGRGGLAPAMMDGITNPFGLPCFGRLARRCDGKSAGCVRSQFYSDYSTKFVDRMNTRNPSASRGIFLTDTPWRPELQGTTFGMLGLVDRQSEIPAATEFR